jgi:hypothetical protein
MWSSAFRFNFDNTFLGREATLGADNLPKGKHDYQYFLATPLFPPRAEVRYMGQTPDANDVYKGDGAMLQCFAHYVYQKSRYDFFISDIQGLLYGKALRHQLINVPGIHDDAGQILLFDPQCHTR